MYKKLSVFLISAVILLSISFTNTVSSQSAGATKFKQSVVNVDLLFCYSQPMPNLFSNMTDFFNFQGYGVKYGFGSQINVKIAANKKGTIKPYISLGYNMFMGSDNNNTYIDSNIIGSIYPMINGTTYSGNPIPGTSKMILHDFSAAGGFEYDFVNKTRWTPYLGAELNMNVLFGTYRQSPDHVIVGGGQIAGPGQTSFTINSAVRFGFGTEAGIYMRVHQAIAFTFCTKFKFDNLLGKSSVRTTELNKMGLLDKSATDLNPLMTKSRNIDYFEFLLGVSFNIGKK